MNHVPVRVGRVGRDAMVVPCRQAPAFACRFNGALLDSAAGVAVIAAASIPRLMRPFAATSFGVARAGGQGTFLRMSTVGGARSVKRLCATRFCTRRFEVSASGSRREEAARGVVRCTIGSGNDCKHAEAAR